MQASCCIDIRCLLLKNKLSVREGSKVLESRSYINDVASVWPPRLKKCEINSLREVRGIDQRDIVRLVTLTDA